MPRPVETQAQIRDKNTRGQDSYIYRRRSIFIYMTMHIPMHVSCVPMPLTRMPVSPESHSHARPIQSTITKPRQASFASANARCRSYTHSVMGHYHPSDHVYMPYNHFLVMLLIRHGITCPRHLAGGALAGIRHHAIIVEMPAHHT